MEATPDLLTTYHDDLAAPLLPMRWAPSVPSRLRSWSGLAGQQRGLRGHGHHRASPGHLLHQLNDKEEAAHFLNDLADPARHEPEPLFFPALSRGPYDPEGHHDGERVTRTEVLEELMRGRRRLTIVTHAEAPWPRWWWAASA
ncbi:MAG: hypothetical protein R2810_01545 [Flavobacteriales bacterium]